MNLDDFIDKGLSGIVNYGNTCRILLSNVYLIFLN